MMAYGANPNLFMSQARNQEKKKKEKRIHFPVSDEKLNILVTREKMDEQYNGLKLK